MWVAAGKIVLEFWGNQNIKEKRHQMADLLTEIHKQFNASAAEVSDFDDLERCVIGLALAAGTEQGARAAMKKLLEHVDTNAFARVVVEDTDVFGYD
ncbi:MAG: DUF503 family protein [Deltaproteobacteria bacterium]|nr:DUF503 family protein [Deltaproteobacteria bacterium]